MLSLPNVIALQKNGQHFMRNNGVCNKNVNTTQQQNKTANNNIIRPVIRTRHLWYRSLLHLLPATQITECIDCSQAILSF